MTENKRNNRSCPLFEKPLELDPPEFFGDWSVYRKLSKDRWLARCICGIEKEVVSYALKYGRSTGCGCRAFLKMAEVITIDLTGQTFGKWVVLGMSKERGANDQVQWDCRCACGVERPVLSQSLRRRMSRSCGCVKSLGPGEYAIRITLRHYRDGARKRGHEWNLTRTQALDLFAQHCC